MIFYDVMVIFKFGTFICIVTLFLIFKIGNMTQSVIDFLIANYIDIGCWNSWILSLLKTVLLFFSSLIFFNKGLANFFKLHRGFDIIKWLISYVSSCRIFFCSKVLKKQTRYWCPNFIFFNYCVFHRDFLVIWAGFSAFLNLFAMGNTVVYLLKHCKKIEISFGFGLNCFLY